MMVDSVAVMIVTSCAIPLLTLFAATKILSVFMGINITINMPKRMGRTKKRNKSETKKMTSKTEEVSPEIEDMSQDTVKGIEEKTTEE